MIELQGKYATAKIFTDTVEEQALAQVQTLLNQPYVKGSRIRMMPDIHAGAGCTIGTTMTVGDKICPNLVGVDIGCGMETLRLCETEIDLQALDALIRREIPSGFSVRATPHPYSAKLRLEELRHAENLQLDRARCSIGTLGGGNHFIEVDRDEEGNLYLVVHSGSRHLGLEIAGFYQEAGYRALRSTVREEIIARYQAQGRQTEIQKALEEIDEQALIVPKPLAYVEGQLRDDYLNDMQIAQEFASCNRKAIADTIVSGLGLHVADQFTTIHNYIDIERGILRKGAVSARKSEVLLVPINMRDGSLICVGKGNRDWNESAPHGAAQHGRISPCLNLKSR